MSEPDAIVVGAGLAGLVATHELVKAGRSVLVVDQENRRQPRRPGVLVARRPVPRRQPRAAPDGHQGLLRAGAAGLARLGRLRPRPRGPLAAPVGRGIRPVRRRREAHLPARPRSARAPARRLGRARRRPRAGHGNSVPRFHLTWGTGPEVVRVFARAGAAAEARGLVRVRVPAPGRRAGRRGRRRRRRPRHGARAERRSSAGVASLARPGGDFELRAQAVVVTSGGIGHNHDLVRKNWPADRLGPAPETMISGVPAHVDGRMLGITEHAGAQHRQPRPDVALHRGHRTTGTRSGPTTRSGSSPARPRCGSTPPASGCRRRNFPGFDTLGTLRADPRDRLRLLVVRPHPDDHREGVRALGLRAEPRRHRQGPQAHARAAAGEGAPGPVEAFKQHGVDFVVRRQPARPRRRHEQDRPRRRSSTTTTSSGEIVARDREVDNKYAKDAAADGDHNARQYRGDRLTRVAKPHRLLDPAHGPLIAVRLTSSPARRSAGWRRTSTRRSSGPTARRSPACTRPARSPASAAAACTATTRWRAPSSAAASSPAARPAARCRPRARRPAL